MIVYCIFELHIRFRRADIKPRLYSNTDVFDRLNALWMERDHMTKYQGSLKIYTHIESALLLWSFAIFSFATEDSKKYF